MNEKKNQFYSNSIKTQEYFVRGVKLFILKMSYSQGTYLIIIEKILKLVIYKIVGFE